MLLALGRLFRGWRPPGLSWRLPSLGPTSRARLSPCRLAGGLLSSSRWLSWLLALGSAGRGATWHPFARIWLSLWRLPSR